VSKPTTQQVTEAALLSALIHAGQHDDGGREIIEQVGQTGLSNDAFSTAARASAYGTMLQLARRGHRWTDYDLIVQLREIEDAPDAEQVIDLLDAGVDPRSAPDHAERLAMQQRKARLATDLQALAQRAANGTDLSMIHAQLRELADQSEPTGSSDGFGFQSADAFDGLDLRREYLIPGPVPTILSGSFKTLKTSIAADLAISIATGARFLNQYQVNRSAKAALMSGESGGYALQNLARRVAWSKRICH